MESPNGYSIHLTDRKLRVHASVFRRQLGGEVEGDVSIVERCPQAGIQTAEVQAGIAVLHRTAQIRRVRGLWRIDRVLSVDASAEPERARELKAVWAEVALQRLRAGARGSFGYSAFAISRVDRRLVTGECVGLYNAQLLDLAIVDDALTEVPLAVFGGHPEKGALTVTSDPGQRFAPPPSPAAAHPRPAIRTGYNDRLLACTGGT